MTNQSREHYPDVAIDKLGSIGGNGGIAMDARPLNLCAVSFGGGIIDSHQNPVLLLENATNHNFEQHRRDGFSFSAHRTDKVIESFILPDNAGGSEPTGNALSAPGKKYTDHDQMQSPGRALMKNNGQCGGNDLPTVWKNPFVKHELAFLKCVLVPTKHIGKMSHFYL